MNNRQRHVLKKVQDLIAFHERVAYGAGQRAEDLKECLETIREAFGEIPDRKIPEISKSNGWGRD